jgi:MoxR-like ATPase
MSEMDQVAAVQHLKEKYEALKKEISKVIVGQDEVVDQLLISMLCRSHSLLVGVPGLAKTLLVNTVAKSLGLTFNRIQFTPDLMPSDIVGSEILDENRRFRFIQGPIFANILLADEINRTPPKTQSALLEAMQERAVTAAGHTYAMPDPFFVLATQNPIEQEGTYPLPEAQLDRFMFNIQVDYPTFEQEVKIVKGTTSGGTASLNEIIHAEDIIKFQSLIREIPVPDSVYEYAVRVVSRSRPDTKDAPDWVKRYLAWGAGPRASQFLILGAKAIAAVSGKYSPDAAEVRKVAIPILRHRIVRNYQAEADGVKVEELIERLLSID